MSPAPLLQAEEVALTYPPANGGRPTAALAKTNMSVLDGEFVCVVGPSGCGKTTLLRILGGLLTPSQGHVFLKNQELTEPRSEVGYVFQHANLMPWRTVLRNVALPLELQHMPAAEMEQRSLEVLHLVGLDGFEHAYPRQLSGGMAQRTALARTLVHEPEVLLLDEPFGALDAITRERMNMELLRIRQTYDYTAVMVTHSIPEAVFLADRVLVMSQRPGRIVLEIPIDLPRPRNVDIMGSPRFARITQQLREAIGEQI
ncbi:MAG: ABC transporter ATP-binding protein [Chloroflexota bacterium]|nr:ABC transporter ATP-binding protein [Chloroflexota bacterium]